MARQGQRGPIDQFHRRLLWSIRDAAGDVVGFGARRLFDDDRLEAKYVNTAETPLYKKSQVLFGLDLAKRDISRQRRVVVVEGYTDVMAMHLAGVTTAVASCGTAFGDEHISVLRRYLLDSEVIRGEVVYTFDGDAAGQKAALKAFDSDQRFAANTFVAVAPAGMDPCELRQAKGDEAVRALVEQPQPAVRVRDQDHAGAVRPGHRGGPGGRDHRRPSRWSRRIKEATLRDEYVRQLAGWLGSDLAPIRARVKDFDAAEARDAKRAAAREAAGQRDASGAVHVAAGLERPPRGPGWSGHAEASDRDAPSRGPDQRRTGTRPAGDRHRRPRAAPAGATRITRTARRTITIVRLDGCRPPRSCAGPTRRHRHLRGTGDAETRAAATGSGGRRLPAGQRGGLHPPGLHRGARRGGGRRWAAGGRSKAAWVDTVADQLPAGPLRSLVSELAVEPPRHQGLTASTPVTPAPFWPGWRSG